MSNRFVDGITDNAAMLTKRSMYNDVWRDSMLELREILDQEIPADPSAIPKVRFL